MGAQRKGRTDLPITPRLRQVIRLSWEGLKDAEIARWLGISPRTVNGYWDRIYDRLGYTTQPDPPGNPRAAAAVWLWVEERKRRRPA